MSTMTAKQAAHILVDIAADINSAGLLQCNAGVSRHGVHFYAFEMSQGDASPAQPISVFGYDHIKSCSPDMAVAEVRAYLAERFGYQATPATTN